MSSFFEHDFHCPKCGKMIPSDSLDGWTVRDILNTSQTATRVRVERCMGCPRCGTRLRLEGSYIMDRIPGDISIVAIDGEGVEL